MKIKETLDNKKDKSFQDFKVNLSFDDVWESKFAKQQSTEMVEIKSIKF